jgi:dynein heavy chain
VADSERSLRQAQRELSETQQQLAALNAQLGQLRQLFSAKTTEAQELRARAELMERRLQAASRLIAGLGSERERWAADIQRLHQQKVQLVGDCLLTAAFLSYTGGRAARLPLRAALCLLRTLHGSGCLSRS